jgi:uncharacterized protein
MDKKVLLVIFLIVGFVVVLAWLRGAFSARTTGSAARVQIGSRTYTVEVVDTIPAKAQGLSGRKSLPAGTGMLFVFEPAQPQSFWMHDMKFPIDIIWIQGGAVTGLVQDAPVPTATDTAIFSSPGPVDLVLEVPAGTVAGDGLRVGDKVEIVR